MNALVRLIDVEMVPSPPYFIQDYAASVLQQALLAPAMVTDKVLICQTGFPPRGKTTRLARGVHPHCGNAKGHGRGRLPQLGGTRRVPQIGGNAGMPSLRPNQKTHDNGIQHDNTNRKRDDGRHGAGVCPAGARALWSILGSCVAVAICDPKRQVGAMSHVVLPSAVGSQRFARPNSPIRPFRTCSNCSARRGDPRATDWWRRSRAAPACSATPCPWKSARAISIPLSRALQAAGIRVAAQDVGGNKGRRVTLDCSSGELLIEILGSPPKTL